MPYRTITIQFSHSSSSALPFAIHEAQKQSSFKQDGKIYSVSYTKDESDKLHKIINHIKGLRNRHVFIDGQEFPWDEVFHYLPCYCLRQKAYDPMEYCSGDSRLYPAFNPWGCIQAYMPLSNDTEWLRYGHFDKDSTWIFNKKKIAHYLNINTYQFRYCPAMDKTMMIMILEAFPETANPKIDKNWEYAEVHDRHIVVSLSLGSKYAGPQHYCGVKPSSPNAIRNIYKKILDKLSA